MAKFDANRMGDSTTVGRVDNQHNAMEEAIEDVFGIPDNTEITAYIFGENPESEDGYPIQPDGSIRGVPVLKSSGVQADPATAVGFKWDDGTKKRLLAFVSSSLILYEDDDYPNESWNEVMNLESPGSGQLINLTDYTETAALADRIGYLLKVNDDGDGFDLQAPSGGVGIDTFVELTDGPGTIGTPAGTVGQILAVAEGGTTLEWIDVPAAATPFIMLVSAQSINGWGDTDDYEDIYQWAIEDPGSSGYLITDEGYLGDDTVPIEHENNKYFEDLPAGVYEFALWYFTPPGYENIEGIRSFRVQGTSIYGPATEGVAHRSTVGFTSAQLPDAIDGAKFLGCKMFLATSITTNLKAQVWQDSGHRIGSGTNITFYAMIRKIG